MSSDENIEAKEVGSHAEIKLLVDGRRVDGRALDEMRPLKIQAGLLHKADGSALVEWGGNKVLAAVYGPRVCLPKRESSPYRAKLSCRYLMSPFASKDEHGKAGPNRRSIELSMVLRQALENVVMLEMYPQSMIDVFIEVLQASGGTRCASLVAASVALANAGIPMKDMPVAVAAGKIENEICLDVGKEEDNYGQADVPIGLCPRNKDIILLQMDGRLTKDEVMKALDYAERAAPIIHAAQVKALEEAYSQSGSEEEEG
ncbi:MAG: exosome complex exonuclease Rrp41 [Candidatus Micrarchaeia archaeon]